MAGWGCDNWALNCWSKLREIGAASVRPIALDVFKRKPVRKNERAAFAKGG